MNIYPEIIHETDFKTPDDRVDIDEYCQEIKDACKGRGMNSDRVNVIMGELPSDERSLVALRYEDIFGKSLREKLKSESSGDYGELLQILSLPSHDAEAKMLVKAMKGLGTDENVLWQILGGRTNDEMAILKKAYFNRSGLDLSNSIHSETSGDFRKLLTCLLQGLTEDFDTSVHTEEKAYEDAEVFYEAGQGRWGTDEHKIFNILCSTPLEYLRMVDEQYSTRYGYTLQKALEKELSGDAKYGASFALGMRLYPFDTIAKLIKSTCAGFGTDEKGLSRCIVRYQTELPLVMEAHERLFHKTLQDRIESEVSGKYKDLLLMICNKAPDYDARPPAI